MFTGTKPVGELAPTAPTMTSLDTDPLTIEHAEVLTVTYELSADVKEAVLPPGLHPPTPPIVTWQVLTCDDSPLGPFRLAQTRIGCRSGARPRAFLVSAVIDSEPAATALSSRWGYACRLGEVWTRHRYDRWLARVTLEDRSTSRTVLDLECVDPVTLRNTDIQWIAGMHLAHTPRGLKLVQVDPDVQVHRAERARPRVHTFDAEAWGEPLLRAVHPVAATRAAVTMTLPRLRYVCAPDRFAFTATEVLDH